jgi:hypothetical protein
MEIREVPFLALGGLYEADDLEAVTREAALQGRYHEALPSRMDLGSLARAGLRWHGLPGSGQGLRPGLFYASIPADN